MGLAIGSRESLSTDVGVTLRGGHIGMTQQLLYSSQVGTTVEEMRRETVP